MRRARRSGLGLAALALGVVPAAAHAAELDGAALGWFWVVPFAGMLLSIALLPLALLWFGLVLVGTALASH